jgi:hypothetical protein
MLGYYAENYTAGHDIRAARRMIASNMQMRAEIGSTLLKPEQVALFSSAEVTEGERPSALLAKGPIRVVQAAMRPATVRAAADTTAKVTAG